MDRERLLEEGRTIWREKDGKREKDGLEREGWY